MIHNTGSVRRQRLGEVGGYAAQRKSQPGNFGRYEALKTFLTAGATTPAEYEAACRRAAKIAGV